MNGKGYIVFCWLTDSWVKGMANGKVTATWNKAEAKVFSSPAEAKKVIGKMDPVWQKEMKILETERTP